MGLPRPGRLFAAGEREGIDVAALCSPQGGVAINSPG